MKKNSIEENEYKDMRYQEFFDESLGILNNKLLKNPSYSIN